MFLSILGYIFFYDILFLLRLIRLLLGNNDVFLYVWFGYFFIICFDYVILMFLGLFLYDVVCDFFEVKSWLLNFVMKVCGFGL